MNFSTYFKFSFLYQLFDIAMLGLMYYGGRRLAAWWANRKLTQKMSEHGFLLPHELGGPAKCTTEWCKLGPRHQMPCWDGTPSADYEERCGGKWVWVPTERRES